MSREWQEIRNQLYSRSIQNGLELAEARQDLFQAAVDRLTRFGIIIRANVRLSDQDAMGHRWLRFATTSGPGWSETILAKIFRIDGPSLGSKLVRDNLSECYLPNVRTSPDYEPLFHDVNSIYLVAVSLRNRTHAILAAESRDGEIDESIRSEIASIARECSQSLEHFALIEDRWMFELFEHLAQRPGLEELCEAVVREIQNIFGAEVVSLFLARESDSCIAAIASTMPNVVFRGLQYGLGEGITGWIAKKRRGLRLRDYRDPVELGAIDPGLKWTNRSGYSNHSVGAPTFLGLPLVHREKLIGVLRMANKRGNALFSLDDEQLLSRIAEALAVRIENHWLIEQQLAEIARSNQQVDLSFEMAAAKTPEELGATLVSRLPQLTEAQHVVVRMMDAGLDLVRIGATHEGFPRAIGLGTTHVGEAAETNRPRFFPAIRGDIKWDDARTLVDDPAVLRDLDRAAVLPLALNGVVIGTLSLFWTKAGEFGPRERRNLEELAGRVAIALDRSRLRADLDSRLEFRNRVLSEIHRVGAALLSSRDPKNLYQQILESAVKILGVTHGTIRTVSADGTVLEGVAARGIADNIVRSNPLPIDILPPVRKAIQTGHPQLIADTSSLPEYRILLDNLARLEQRDYWRMVESTKSILVVPIVLHGRPLAVIFLDSQKPIHMSDALETYIEILSGYSAIAIENARFHLQKEESLRLQEPLALMGQLLNGYLHSVRNPLQGITSTLNLICHPQSRPESLSGYLAAIRQSVKRLEKITMDMRLLAQSHSFRNFAPIDLRALVDEVVSEFRNDHPCVDWLTPSSVEVPVEVKGNSVQLRIALRMLIQNSIEAMNESERKAEIRIVAIAARDECELTVTDTGCGMEDETRKRAQETFFTTKGDGSGLGLAIVAGVVTRHNGRIEIQSKPGEGTSVRISLPRMQSEESIEIQTFGGRR